MDKIENNTNTNTQTQQYTNEIKPNINIYNNNSSEGKTTDTSTNIINNTTSSTRSAAEDYGIATAAGITGIIGAGAIGAGIQNYRGKLKGKIGAVGGT